MRLEERGPTGAGGTPRAEGSSLPELERLRATSRRQATLIDTLGETVATLSTATTALKAENADLRGEIARLRSNGRADWPADRQVSGPELADVAIPLGVQAPRVARGVIDRCLTNRVPSSVLENARLLVSELVSNSVRHSGAADGDDVIVRVHLWRDRCRIEVEDPGSDGVIAPRPQGLAEGMGMGLNVVQMLSQRWGVVRAAGGPTRVWAQLSCAPSADDAGLGGRPPGAAANI
jgi:anti-sigma regulatory factor (Ser/Thr protein kinase)